MKAYRVQVVLVDHEGVGEEEIASLPSNYRYLCATVFKIEEKEIGNWTDDHPLNRHDTFDAEVER